MIDITHKSITGRRAIAGGWLVCQPETLDMIHNDGLPKGNLFDIARAAALLAAKQTTALIPHCHPVSIDGTMVEFFYEFQHQHYYLDTNGRRHSLNNAPAIPTRPSPVDASTATLFARVSVDSVARTGPEMEALLACSVALLTIYDLLKPVDKSLCIIEQRLLEKLGGKSDPHLRIKEGTSVAILYHEKQKAKIPDAVQTAMDIITKQSVDLEDCQVLQLNAADARKQIAGFKSAIIITIGGTAPRTGSPVSKLMQTIAPDEIPGLSEAMRRHGGDRTPLALYSRSYAASLEGRLILCLPGSQDGVRQSLQALIPALWQGPRMLGSNRSELKSGASQA